MKIKNYWKDINERLQTLVTDGFVKLPSLDIFELNGLATGISDEMNGSTFAELCTSHRSFLNDLCIEQYLTPKLLNIAQNIYGYKGPSSNQYHIARRVEAGNSKEMYRAHFDSHLFTMVLPIKIPQSIDGSGVGELIYFPNARSLPKTEVSNVFSKAYHKRFASAEGIEKFSLKHEKREDSFHTLEPLLFVGKNTLHTNKEVSLNCSSYRLTLLAHFFDTSPKYGVGSLLRILRNR